MADERIDETPHEKPAEDALEPGASGRPQATIACPWCGERQELFLEPAPSGGEQRYVEECRECGRDYEVVYELDDAGAPRVRVDRP